MSRKAKRKKVQNIRGSLNKTNFYYQNGSILSINWVENFIKKSYFWMLYATGN